MHFIGIIPARFASTRFPGKPLAMIHGKSMIRRVYEQAVSCKTLNTVVVATDDQRIYDHVSGFGRVVMTRADHASGTARCLEAFQKINTENMYGPEDGIVNIQGDEPFIDPGQIDQVVACLKDPRKHIVTLAKRITHELEIHDPNVVKVVFSQSGNAMYFSRGCIPFVLADGNEKGYAGLGIHYKHIGIYGYRAVILKRIVSLKESSLEAAEKLEQLRWMQQDFKIFVEETYKEGFAIDTPEDLKKVLKHSGGPVGT